MTTLADTAHAMVARGKGLLAIDESIRTCNRRFRAVEIPETSEMRRAYRELIITTPELGESISAVILCDETFHQYASDGTPLVELVHRMGMLVGIKVDAGPCALAGRPRESITEGLDGLRARLDAYARAGARFAKWRAVLTIGPGLPSATCVRANAHALARYAALCQEAGLVPIIEPEVLMTGRHPIERCGQATEFVLHETFEQLRDQGVELEGMILKPNMVIPGTTCDQQATPAGVAGATLQCLRRTVPAAVAGIAFLSGGQSPEQATSHLNAIAERSEAGDPWAITFSFGRAIQQPALRSWHGDPARTADAQRALLRCAHRSSEARAGRLAPPA